MDSKGRDYERHAPGTVTLAPKRDFTICAYCGIPWHGHPSWILLEWEFWRAPVLVPIQPARRTGRRGTARPVRAPTPSLPPTRTERLTTEAAITTTGDL